MKRLIFALLILINCNIAFAGNRDFIIYKDAMLVEANGYAITDIIYIPYEYIKDNIYSIPYRNNHMDKRFMMLEEINDTIREIIEKYAPNNKSEEYYGCLKVYLKNGKTFYVLMNTINKPKILKEENPDVL